MTQVLESLVQIEPKLCEAVRFVSLRTLRKAAREGRMTGRTPIVPRDYVGFPGWAYADYIFAIDKKELSKWTDNEQFPQIMENLMSYVKGRKRSCDTALVSFDVMASDEPYVLDLARRANTLYERDSLKRLKSFLQNCYVGPSAEWKAYIESRVPYAEYRGDYLLPEIVISKPIENNRITIEKYFSKS